MFEKKETCSYYKCCDSTGKHDCSQCNQLPCQKFFEYPDPDMSDEFKQMWLKLRMDNINKLRPDSKIQIEDDFQKNVDKFNKN